MSHSISRRFWSLFLLLGTIVVLAACVPAATSSPPSPTVTATITLQPSPTRAAEESTRTTQPTRTTRPPTLTPTPTAALINGSTSKIALASCDTRLASCEIFVINADGSQVFRMTNNNIDECCPDWSPDGSRIAFVSERDGNQEIYVMNADGSGLTNLTDHSALDNSPAWSPDGARIAFYSNRDGNPEIYVMNADGSNPIQLTNNGDNYGPAWSPDGTKIAFFHDGMDREMWVINADGSNTINLTISSGWDLTIAWSPDSNKLAFVSQGASNLREISVIDADGSGRTQLTNDELWHCCPAWSPDSRKLAYVHDIEGTPEIRVINADGSNPISLAALAGGDTRVCAWPLAWSPDGTRIAFMSCHDRGTEIYVMNADGSSLTQLTTTGGSGPVWSADGTKIAFIEQVKGYVYVMNADGSGLVNSVIIAHTSSFSWQPILDTPSTLGPDCTLGGTRLTAGTLAQVYKTLPATIRVWSGPRLNNEEIAQLPPGTVVEVLEGPVCADGFVIVFWKVESDLIPGGVGWTTEDYLVPYNP